MGPNEHVLAVAYEADKTAFVAVKRLADISISFNTAGCCNALFCIHAGSVFSIQYELTRTCFQHRAQPAPIL